MNTLPNFTNLTMELAVEHNLTHTQFLDDQEAKPYQLQASNILGSDEVGATLKALALRSMKMAERIMVSEDAYNEDELHILRRWQSDIENASTPHEVSAIIGDAHIETANEGLFFCGVIPSEAQVWKILQNLWMFNVIMSGDLNTAFYEMILG